MDAPLTPFPGKADGASSPQAGQRPRLVALTHGLVSQNLGKRFKKRPVVRGVSLHIQRGEVVLLGPEARQGDIVLPSRLKKVTYRGVYSDYRLRLSDGQELSATLTHRRDLREGEEVLVGVKSEDIVILDEDRDAPA